MARNKKYPTPALPLKRLVSSSLAKESPELYGIPELLFGIVIFLYCLGPENFWLEAFKLVTSKTTIFVVAYRRVLAVLFWFVVLGPLGAVLYRLIDLLANESMAARRVQQVLDWVPVRIFTFIFALGGHFTEVFARWKVGVKKGLLSNENLLTDCGIAALDLDVAAETSDEAALQKQVVQLMDRVLVISLVVLAVIVLLT